MSLKKSLKETPSQTAGPYVHIGTMPGVAGIDVPGHDTSNNTGLEGGTPIVIKGVIRDGGGELVKDAAVHAHEIILRGAAHLGHVERLDSIREQPLQRHGRCHFQGR